MKILFVCLGNSERSVIAEELYNKITKSKNSFSAGIKISNLPIDNDMIKLMNEYQIDVSKKTKTQLTEKILNRYEKVFILCKKEKCPQYLIKSKKITFWDIQDPDEKGYEFLVKTKQIIKKHIKSII